MTIKQKSLGSPVDVDVADVADVDVVVEVVEVLLDMVITVDVVVVLQMIAITMTKRKHDAKLPLCPHMPKTSLPRLLSSACFEASSATNNFNSRDFSRTSV